ncbi:uncharacterized protein K452DRAFT_266714 [Aplosporella prunicola CBS 121167]|uniref:AAA+ ATPase domain-containing protein n=1 Tax=Aplosporella prunicola CBS 121167 TaxID=1176127 RepID=A0A6A6BLY4_9PEZI|nr:uncharacterized protein K452DRAFT_266714 [Aplosporella prunicola CBS 121167]KAF2144688.1 hypothetical protein K452DRAFT_266714 [Aplosporella prunicola CBS 121167]
MMRQKPSSSAMQKTYDDCYLVCSTAVYFETQGNEAEALRSWRSALDQIYYFNAHRRPANYAPKTETEKALQASLRELELQCKERVDLLEALEESRKETKKGKEHGTLGEPAGPVLHATSATPKSEADRDRAGWLAQGTIPPVNYPDLSRPALPKRPSLLSNRSSDGLRSRVSPRLGTSAPALSVPPLKKSSRTPSPEKKVGMLRTLRPGNKDGRKSSSSRLTSGLKGRPPAAAKAATQAWGSMSSPGSRMPMLAAENASKEALTAAAMSKEASSRTPMEAPRQTTTTTMEPFASTSPGQNTGNGIGEGIGGSRSLPSTASNRGSASLIVNAPLGTTLGHERKKTPSPPNDYPPTRNWPNLKAPENQPIPKPGSLRLRTTEYPPGLLNARKVKPRVAPKPPEARCSREGMNLAAENRVQRLETTLAVHRKAVAADQSSRAIHMNNLSIRDEEDGTSSGLEQKAKPMQNDKAIAAPTKADTPPSPMSDVSTNASSELSPEEKAWKERVERLMKRLPKGVDEAAAKQIFNEIVIQGDEVHWNDVAGLEAAKSALKETVVYPFLRPDLFMGLREPARGMLLFGPPGTGKTMLARAVATESKSTFFAISASSLTSKYLGESEKLVRALFQLAKALSPSIIFVDEIDSLLSSRSGSNEHEATRRIKTEFLIQWSDLAKAAAGREQTEKDKEKGDASRVLVLAATNLPWAIDEAARRRFVRRQYIPLPEDHVRKLQLKTLLSHQKHSVTDEDLDELVTLTEGFSGSDITALAKDAAMGPLRVLGEKLLHMTMDEIRPIQLSDFQASLTSIRPSVSKQGLKEFEDWAKEFGERGG